ncbi:MAG: DHH family phosphoesterase [Clostridia bacterium]|nr:DHH family phosphoesterase [Clostridia bacterium]
MMHSDKMTDVSDTAPQAARADLYRELLRFPGCGDGITYVIGHRNPDSDSVGSAIAYAWLLNQVGIPAEAAIAGPVNAETAWALGQFDIPAPRIMSKAAGGRFVLVDHSAFSQAIDGMDHARIVGIVDHHGIGDVGTDERIFVRSAPTGAAASLVYAAYLECNVPVPGHIAKVLLMSILSDTRNMTRNVTALDRAACEAVTKFSGIQNTDALYLGMSSAIAKYDGMTDWEIFQTDFKAYEAGGIRFCIGDVNAFGEDAVREMVKRMQTVMRDHYDDLGFDLMYTIINNKGRDDSENMMYMVCWGDGAETLLRQMLCDDNGSHTFTFRKNLSRKSDVVPALTTALMRQQVVS